MESKRLFYVVEFPEEEDNGSCPMAIVSSGWIFTENGKQYCWWPNYKNDRTRDNAIKSHTEIGPENASMCFINIKYKTESFEKAKKKLKMLETESDVDTDSSANIKRKSIPSGRLQDYVLSDSDDSNGIPSIPHPPVVQKNIRRLSQVSEAAENSFTQLNNNNEVCTNCNSSYELLMELYKKQEKYMLELNEKLDYLTGLMQNNVFSEDRTVGQDVILPVETLQDLQNLDNEFLDNPDKYNQYLDVLKLVERIAVTQLEELWQSYLVMN